MKTKEELTNEVRRINWRISEREIYKRLKAKLERGEKLDFVEEKVYPFYKEVFEKGEEDGK